MFTRPYLNVYQTLSKCKTQQCSSHIPKKDEIEIKVRTLLSHSN